MNCQIYPIQIPTKSRLEQTPKNNIKNIVNYSCVNEDPQENFFDKLYNEKIIDANAYIIIDVANRKLPALLNEQANQIYELLNNKFEVVFDEQIDNKTNHYKKNVLIKELINALISGQHEEKYAIYIRGGYLRKILLNHSYFFSALKELGVRNPDKFLSNDILEESRRKVPDVDFVIKIPKSENVDLYSYGIKMIGYLNQIFFKSSFEGVQRIKKNAFTKFKVEKKEGNEFAIITLRGGNGLQLEFLIERELKREKLFSLDDFQIEITPLLDKNVTNSTPLLVQSGSNGLQSLLDLGTKTIHIEKPEEINEYGLPMLLSYYSRGYVLGTPDSVKFLISKSITLKKEDSIRSDQLIAQISKVIAEHHNNDPLTAIPMAFNAYSKMEECFSENEMAHLVDKMAQTYSQRISEKIQKGSLLYLIAHAIFTIKIPVTILKACLELGAIYRLATENTDNQNTEIRVKLQVDDEKPAIQIRFKESELAYHLLIPFSLLESIEKIKRYFEKEGPSSVNISCLTAILEKLMHGSTIFKESGLLPLLKFRKQFNIEEEKISSMTNDLLSSKNRPLRFFGYALQLALGSTFPNEKYIQDLLFHYVDAANFAKDITLQNPVTSIMKMTAYSPLCPPENNPIQKYHEICATANIKEKLIIWASSLAKTQDRSLCEVSYQLWMYHYTKYDEGEQNKFGIQLLLDLLPHGVDYGIRILYSLQKNINSKLLIEEETKALSKIISSIKGLENTPLSTENTQRMTLLLSRFVEKSLAKSSVPIRLSNPFIEQFNWFVQHKLAHQDAQKAHYLLNQASKIEWCTNDHENLSLSWAETLQASLNSGDINASFNIWKDGKVHNVWKIISCNKVYQTCLLTLLKNLLKDREKIKNGFGIWKDLVEAPVQEKERETFKLETIKLLNTLTGTEASLEDIHLACRILNNTSLGNWIKNSDTLRAEYFTKCLISLIGMGKPEKLTAILFVLENALEYVFEKNQANDSKTKSDASNGLEFALKQLRSSPIQPSDNLKQKISNSLPSIIEFHYQQNDADKALEIIENVKKENIEITYDIKFTSLCIQIIESSLKNLPINSPFVEKAEALLLKLEEKIHTDSIALQKLLLPSAKIIVDAFLESKESQKAFYWMDKILTWGGIEKNILFLTERSLPLVNIDLERGIDFLNSFTNTFPNSEKIPASLAKVWKEVFEKTELTNEQKLQEHACLTFHEKIIKTGLFEKHLEILIDCMIVWLRVLRKIGSETLAELLCEAITADSTFRRLLSKIENIEKLVIASHHLINGNLNNLENQEKDNNIIKKIIQFFYELKEKNDHSPRCSNLIEKVKLDLIKNLLKLKHPQDLEYVLGFLNESIYVTPLDNENLNTLRCIIRNAAESIGLNGNKCQVQLFSKILDYELTKKITGKVSHSFSAWCIIKRVIKDKYNSKTCFETSLQGLFCLFESYPKIAHHEPSLLEWIDLTLNFIIAANNNTKAALLNEIYSIFLNIFLNDVRFFLIKKDGMIFIPETLMYNKNKIHHIEVNTSSKYGEVCFHINETSFINTEGVKTPEGEAKVKLYYRSVSLLILKFMNQAITCNQHHKIVSNFINNLLFNLPQFLPDYNKETVELLDKYIFWLKPDNSERFIEHEKSALFLCDVMIQLKAYKDIQLSLFKHATYLHMKVTVTDLLPSQTAEIIEKLIKQLLTINTERSIIKAATIIKRVQNKYGLNAELRAFTFNILISKIKKIPFTILYKIPYFEYIGYGITDPESLNTEDPSVKSVITQLSKTLYHKVYEIYTHYETLEIPAEFSYTKTEMLHWLMRFVMSSYHWGTFIKEKDANAFLSVTKTLMLEAIKQLPDTKKNIELNLPQVVLHFILGCPILGQDTAICSVTHVEAFSKGVRNKQSQLISIYLNALLDQREPAYIIYSKSMIELLDHIGFMKCLDLKKIMKKYDQICEELQKK